LSGATCGVHYWDAKFWTKPMVDLARISKLLAERKPGCGLPQALYNEQNSFDFDMQAIFARSWILVGFDCELNRPGSWMSAMVGPWPVLITRDRAGELHAFHNTCRHRGAMLCKSGKGQAARLVCPYHRWTYELSGELVHAARMGEDFRTEEHGLFPVHVESVHGALYVCLAETPPDISGFRRAIEPLLAPHRLHEAKLAHENVLVEKGNWKLAMENGRECYHCAGAHPELARFFPVDSSAHFDFGEDRRQEEFEARLAGLGLPIGPVEGDWWQAMRFVLNEGYRSTTMDGAPASRPLMCEIGDGDIGSLRWSVEPHAFVHATADHAFMFSVVPVSPRETHVIGKWLVHKDAVEGVDYDVDNLIELWNVTNLQDRELVENNQCGVDSLGFQPGPFSPDAETLALRFLDWYCRKAASFIGGPALAHAAE